MLFHARFQFINTSHIFSGIQEFLTENPNMIYVYFLLSIDRRLGLKEAEDTIDLAIEYKQSSKGIVVGK